MADLTYDGERNGHHWFRHQYQGTGLMMDGRVVQTGRPYSVSVNEGLTVDERKAIHEHTPTQDESQ